MCMHNGSQEFDAWNKLKKQLSFENDTVTYFPKEGEVWMCSLGKNIGYEQNGGGGNFSRPVLIIKKFNNQMFWCVTLSTKQKRIDFYFNFTDPHDQAVSAILAQMKLVSVRRLRRKLYEIAPDLLLQIKSTVQRLLK